MKNIRIKPTINDPRDYIGDAIVVIILLTIMITCILSLVKTQKKIDDCLDDGYPIGTCYGV